MNPAPFHGAECCSVLPSDGREYIRVAPEDVPAREAEGYCIVGGHFYGGGVSALMVRRARPATRADLASAVDRLARLKDHEIDAAAILETKTLYPGQGSDEARNLEAVVLAKRARNLRAERR